MYANGYTLQITGNDMCIRFGIQEDTSKPDVILEEAGVYMTLTSAKLLAGMLTNVIKKFESESNTTIPFSQEKIDSVLSKMVVNKRSAG